MVLILFVNFVLCLNFFSGALESLEGFAFDEWLQTDATIYDVLLFLFEEADALFPVGAIVLRRHKISNIILILFQVNLVFIIYEGGFQRLAVNHLRRILLFF